MSDLKMQKELASKVLGVGITRIKIDPTMAEDVKEAITREDIRDLISHGVITVAQKEGVSRHRARERHLQRKRGRQRGHGKHKGYAGSRTPHKQNWMNKIRAIRSELKELLTGDYITKPAHTDLYKKAKGNFFRDRTHMLVYLQQRSLTKKSLDERLEKKKRRRYRRVKK